MKVVSINTTNRLACKLAVNKLIHKSIWVQVEPLQDDELKISVKEKDGSSLKQIMAYFS